MPSQERSARVFPGTSITELYGIPISDGNFPFNLAAYDPFHLLSNSDGEQTGRFFKPNEHHRRNHEVRFGQTPAVLRSDEYGNLFSKLEAKGSNAETIRLVHTNRSDLGFMVWGLSDSQSLLRRIRASQILRQAGVDTEKIDLLFKPDELPIDGTFYSTVRPEGDLSPFENQLLFKLLTNPHEAQETELRFTYEVVPSDFEGALNYLNQVEFFVEYRSTLLSESLNDLLLCETKEEFEQKLAVIFAIVNLTEDVKANRDPNYEKEHFEIASEDDRERYFFQFLPKRLAQNLAKIHEAGLVHWAVGLGNILANGGLKDLEYVFGIEFGDRIREGEGGDVFIDVEQAQDSLDMFITMLIKRGWLVQDKTPIVSEDEIVTDEDEIDALFELISATDGHVYMMRHQFGFVYHRLRGKRSEMAWEKIPLADYPWKYLEHVEFCIAQSNFIWTYLESAPSEEDFRDDMLAFLSYMYNWDFNILNQENQLDPEDMIGVFIDELQTSIQRVPNLDTQELERMKVEGVTPEEQVLTWAYTQQIGTDTETMFQMFLLDKIHERVKQELENTTLDTHTSYLRPGSHSYARFIHELANFYACREQEKLVVLYEQQGIIELVETAVSEMEKREVALVLSQMAASSGDMG